MKYRLKNKEVMNTSMKFRKLLQETISCIAVHMNMQMQWVDDVDRLTTCHIIPWYIKFWKFLIYIAPRLLSHALTSPSYQELSIASVKTCILAMVIHAAVN